MFLAFIFNTVEAQTTITLQPGPEDGNDASIWSGAVTPYGDRESLTAYTWTNSGNLGLKRAFLMFDYSSIPENAIITNAKLSLYYNPTDPIESFDVHTGVNDIYIQRVISEWDEHSLLWANQPGITMENQVELPPSSNPRQDYLDIDVTNLVIDMLDTSNGNYGFMLRMKDELNFYKSVLFTSSDHIETALRPKLEISYLSDSVDCITIKPGSDTGKDAFIWDVNPNNNYGDSHEFTITAWTNSNIPALRRCFIDFDFSELPSEAIIVDATLSLYNDSTSLSTNGEHSQLSGSNEMLVQRVVDPWNEEEINWNNQPGFSVQNEVLVPASKSPHQDYSIDVTSLVCDMIEFSKSSFGFKLKLQTEEYYRSLIFASSNHIESALHPQLRICFINTSSVPEGEEIGFSFNLFPNPANRTVSVEFDFAKDVSLEIINTHGQIIRKIFNIQATETLDISNFPKGMYLVRLISNEIVVTKKLIVN